MNQVVSLLRQRRADDAVTVARQQVSTAPLDTATLSGLAHALMGKRQYDEALDTASRAIELAPDDVSLRFLRTRVNYARGDYRAALRDALEAAEKSQEVGDHFFIDSCLLLAASCQVKLGRQKEALDVLAGLGEGVKVRAGKLVTREAVYQDAQALSLKKDRGKPMGMA